ncbi:type I-E CRISPR-associated protein Cas7/Cse4/CasC [Anaerolineae bacterium CFX9]|nr:type I-E CRISPR-associated protein Cas7/Cse4/CasC [Anaerolineae bacterium CFX9]
MIIELHAIQSFGPSNLNRDDTGNPKEAIFGGVRRARISSQAAKRAIRVSEVFKRATSVPSGMRTKLLVDQITGRLAAEGVDADFARQYASEVTTKLFAGLDKKAENKTSVLVYISEGEITLIVDYCLEALQRSETPDVNELVKRFVKQLANRTSAPDIALFGRMLAEKPELNIDAACQMAHALSTHEVNTAEFDYFTAVDDLQSDDTSGAGMLGLVMFNAATYYRCARIDWDQLVRNLDGDIKLARRTVEGFMRAFALVVPSGMKNAFVNQHAPDFLLAATRPDNDGQSLDNAFERPVRPKQGSGYVEPSIRALATYWEQVDRAFRVSPPVLAVMNPRGYELPSEELTQASKTDLNTWVEAILQSLNGE